MSSPPTADRWQSALHAAMDACGLPADELIPLKNRYLRDHRLVVEDGEIRFLQALATDRRFQGAVLLWWHKRRLHRLQRRPHIGQYHEGGI